MRQIDYLEIFINKNDEKIGATSLNVFHDSDKYYENTYLDLGNHLVKSLSKLVGKPTYLKFFYMDEETEKSYFKLTEIRHWTINGNELMVLRKNQGGYLKDKNFYEINEKHFD
ncbi:hypothetical protein [Sporolactobacillus sp. KGMB 08714]|uniref:hypothetical protein n=1 Tax=Sporolactobacillus sp. KGMB 08714 TaxID=3064704 RepID=UPI002FBE244B